MTSRERLIRTFSCKKTDRIPVSPFIWSNFVYEFYGKKDIDVDEKIINIYKHFGFDIIHRTCTVWDAFDNKYLDSKNWRVSVTNESLSSSKWRETTIIKTPETELTQVKEFERISNYEEVNAIVDYFIKTKDDLKQFIKYQPEVPVFDCNIIKRSKEMVDEDGIIAPWANGVFNEASNNRKLEQLIMDAYIDPEFYKEMMEYFLNRLIRTNLQFVDAGADVLSYNANIANGSIAGPRYFEEFVLSYEAILISQLQNKGTHALYHNCGDTNNLFSIYNNVGMSALETLTEPPFGDTNLDYALATLNPEITLMGNIDQIEFLKTADVNSIFDRVERICLKIKPRGNFILSTSDYIGDGTPHKNIMALSEAGRKFGVY